jgi:hypothetical protein
MIARSSCWLLAPAYSYVLAFRELGHLFVISDAHDRRPPACTRPMAAIGARRRRAVVVEPQVVSDLVAGGLPDALGVTICELRGEDERGLINWLAEHPHICNAASARLEPVVAVAADDRARAPAHEAGVAGAARHALVRGHVDVVGGCSCRRSGVSCVCEGVVGR